MVQRAGWGSLGVSYVGRTAELLLANEHPAVGAAAPRFAAVDLYGDAYLPGGLRNRNFTKQLGLGVRALDRGQPWPGEEADFRPVRPVDEDSSGQLRAAAIREHMGNVDVADALERLVYRDDLYAGVAPVDAASPLGWLPILRRTSVPIYSYSGWFDGPFATAAIKRYRTLRTPGSRLIIGPWNHGGDWYYSPAVGKYPTGFDHDTELLRFFEYHLTGRKTGIESEGPVWYYTMGAERWQSASAWPPPGFRPQHWYLAPGAHLGQAPVPRRDAWTSYAVDTTVGSGSTSRWRTVVTGNAVEYPDRQGDDAKLVTYRRRSIPISR